MLLLLNFCSTAGQSITPQIKFRAPRLSIILLHVRILRYFMITSHKNSNTRQSLDLFGTILLAQIVLFLRYRACQNAIRVFRAWSTSLAFLLGNLFHKQANSEMGLQIIFWKATRKNIAHETPQTQREKYKNWRD